jgi:hypothetical protein
LQVKGLLKDDKVDLLVDPDLKDNYEYKEVEELIQVCLLVAFLSYLMLATGDESVYCIYSAIESYVFRSNAR